MRISEVSARSGVPPTTLRYYEDLGLIQSERSDNGYRDYPVHILERLSFIDTAKKMDLQLSEIKWLLEATETGSCTSYARRTAARPHRPAEPGRGQHQATDGTARPPDPIPRPRPDLPRQPPTLQVRVRLQSTRGNQQTRVLTVTSAAGHVPVRDRSGMRNAEPEGCKTRYEIADPHLTRALTALVDVSLAVDESAPCLDPACSVPGCDAAEVGA